MDLTTFTDRFPRPGETIFGRSFHLGFGGKGANQAVAAKRCGGDVSMVARVGEDLFGPATINNFERVGIDTRFVMKTERVSSGVAPIFVDSSGQNRILVVKGANDRLSPADVDAARDVIASAAFVILQLEIPLETVQYALRFARECSVRTILNPAPGQALPLDQLGPIDYLIPNETEAEVLTGMTVASRDDARACVLYLLEKGIERVILTLGQDGAWLGTKAGVTHVPAYPVQAVDTTGAGDAFIGSLACFLGQGIPEAEAIQRANLYAALSTLAIGTQSSFVDRARFDAEWAARERQTS